ncbi:hypothetical protein N657DRAFT_577813 [Parathielavia appendiculata]|uniref:Uncharacterized protein n=1 Tax=Parathielavia appendiculata TaxID=2587402 RepID=A0AAN6TWI7_9PEZI|nr:hypothetical protein N657DRAFT_577813 [Parathielavia appendiculata]
MAPPLQPPPPPPPPPALTVPNLNGKDNKVSTSPSNPVPSPPEVPQTGPPNSLLVSLLMYNGWPFADHWEYFVASPRDPNKGLVVQAAGDVRGGFRLEVKRGFSLRIDDASREYMHGVGCFPGVFEGEKDGDVVVEGTPRCEFERTLFKVPAPGKTLRAVDAEHGDAVSLSGMVGMGDGRRKITQRNCQTWVVESAEQLVREGIFEQRVVDYLRATSIMTQTSQ